MYGRPCVCDKTMCDEHREMFSSKLVDSDVFLELLLKDGFKEFEKKELFV